MTIGTSAAAGRERDVDEGRVRVRAEREEARVRCIVES